MDNAVQLPDQLTQYLKALRETRGLTQAQLAERLGVGQPRVADIERYPGKVSIEQMLKVFAALGVQMVVRERPGPGAQLEAHASARASMIASLTTGPRSTAAAPHAPGPGPAPQDDDLPRGEW